MFSSGITFTTNASSLFTLVLICLTISDLSPVSDIGFVVNDADTDSFLLKLLLDDPCYPNI